MHARDGRAAVEEMATDAPLDLVFRRWLLLAVLAVEEPSGAGVDAHGECPGITVPFLDVRLGLVLPGYRERLFYRCVSNVLQAKKGVVRVALQGFLLCPLAMGESGA